MDVSGQSEPNSKLNILTILLSHDQSEFKKKKKETILVDDDTQYANDV